MSLHPAVRAAASILALSAALVARPAAVSTAADDSQDRSLPELTQPVNDFAHIIDAESAHEIDRVIRTLKAASGDVIVVATVPTLEPYADINEYAVKLFENHGRGIGDKDKDNGLLIVVALKERQLRIEVGYDLEQWITDGYAGETRREFMNPLFRQGQYGAGLLAGTERIAARIAQGRGVTLEGVRVPRQTARRRNESGVPSWVLILIFIIIWFLGRTGRGRRSRFWGGGGWSGWSSGVGPFGGGWSSGGGGGFGGGFGGFGGGSSGGGGSGGSW
ncbi:MAG TPA: TPM domain-containing protein [Vicinamibacterales bacterium]